MQTKHKNSQITTAQHILLTTSKLSAQLSAELSTHLQSATQQSSHREETDTVSNGLETRTKRN